MNYKNIFVKALEEALIEEKKAENSIAGLLKEIAIIKRDQLEDIIKKEEPYKSEGFVYANISYNVSRYENNAFSVTAHFILKDIHTPANATKKEFELLKEYKELVKDARWDTGYNIGYLKEYVDKAESITASLRYLKNGMVVSKRCTYRFKLSDILEGESFFKRGYFFRDE